MQAALISAPLVLSEIYSSSREAVYYVTAGLCGYMEGIEGLWQDSEL